MTGEHIQTGEKGERAAVEYLKRHCYSIVERNYRNSFGEIDVIAKDKDVVVFVEVKTKKKAAAAFAPPTVSVTKNKQKQIIKTSFIYIKQHKITLMKIRFDVVSVIIDPDGEVRDNGIQLIKNAFQTGFFSPLSF